jgi:hypothetical protein
MRRMSSSARRRTGPLPAVTLQLCARTAWAILVFPNTAYRSALWQPRQGGDMDTTTLLIIIIVVLILFGGGWYGRGRWF